MSDLLAEYRAVLLRPAIRRRHGLSDAAVEVVLTELALNGTVHEPASSANRFPMPPTATGGLWSRAPRPPSW